MIIDSTSSAKPLPGLPIANRPNRKTQAKMLISMTFFMPKRLRKKGMARIKSVSEICETEMRILGYLTAKESAYRPLKSCR